MLFKNHLINALTVFLVIAAFYGFSITGSVAKTFPTIIIQIILVILVGIAILLLGNLIVGFLLLPVLQYRNPANYKYKTKTVVLADGSTKYCALVQTELFGYYRYICKSRWESLFETKFAIFDEEYDEDECSLEDKKKIYYDLEEDALFAIKTYKTKEESEYRQNKAYKRNKKHEKEMMRETSSKTTTVKFEKK